MKNKNLHITGGKNDPYRGLCNGSNYGFILDDNYWSSVIHYIEAKKFEGTAFEENIKKSKTSLQVKRKTRGRKMLTAKPIDEYVIYENETFYGGRKSGYQIKTDWEIDIYPLVKQAVKTKLEQHAILRKLLLSTSPCTLEIPVSSYNSDVVINKMTSKILMKIRSALLFEEMKCLTTKSIKQNKLLDSNQPKDLISDFMNYEPCFDIVLLLIQLSLYIAKMEGWDRVYPGMVEDAIYNLYNVRGKCYIPKAKISIEHQPNLVVYCKNIREEFIKYDSSQGDNIQSSEKIAKYILWCTLGKNRLFFIHNKAQKFFNEKDENGNIKFRKFDIVIPPSNREYRKTQPPKVRKIK